MPFEPIAAAMEIGRSGFAGHLYLCTGIPPEFSALARRGYFELRNRIHADAIRELLIHSRVRYGFAIDGKVILVRTLSVEGGASGSCIGRSTGNSFQEAGKIA